MLPDSRLSGLAAGLHLVLDLGTGAPDAAAVVRAAAALEVGLVDMRRYQVTPSTSSTRLVLGYGNLADARLGDAVERLASCVGRR
jgi:GntR family transcriptional regulator / MocR family aminotransferase